jgi:hypothetical protein
MTQGLEGYVNRFTPDKKWDEVAFRSSGSRPIYLQQAELVEMQSIFSERIRGIGDAILKDGAVIRDARISVDADTGDVSLESGAVYVRGAVRGVPPKAFVIPTEGTVYVGIRLTERFVTELEDPTLLGQIDGSAAFGQPGAARRVIDTEWGHSADGVSVGEFYPVYVVDDGNLRSNEPPPQIDGVRQAIARYDIDNSGGTYVVSGLDVRQQADLESGDQVYTVTAGRARVHGLAVELQASSRIVYAAEPDIRSIDAEPHASSGPNAQRITLDRSPVSQIRQVRITAEKTVSVVHGVYAGVSDPLPDPSVVEIVEVKQGGTTYVAGTDYRLQAGKVDWSLTGAEPSTGSTYSVKYRYITSVTPTAVDTTGFTVEGAVAGTLVLTTYDVQLPRIDRLCLTVDGLFQWVKGVSADYNPVPPTVPSHLLPLASVRQTWDDARVTVVDGTRMVSMQELRLFNDRLDELTQMLAEQRLVGDVSLRDAAYKRGVFVDPLRDDSMRDAGVEQTAAVVDGELVLPIAATITRLPSDVSAPTTLPYTKVPVVEQIRKTGGMKVNPYMAFAPLPADVVLNPAIDRWEVVESQYTSPVTRTFNTGSGNTFLSSSSQSVEEVAKSSTAISTLRSIVVAFTVNGFGPNERLTGVTFDGISVATSPASITADAHGALSGVFTIPANIPAGRKLVVFSGHGGSRGEAIFQGEGTLTVRTLRNVTNVTRRWFWTGVDPLAQTFSLPSSEQIVSVELAFRSKGSSDVMVDLRTTDIGLPTATVVSRVRKGVSDISTSGFTSFDFEAPVLVDGQSERAIVAMCDDADAELSVAELGKFDQVNGWVTSQPYNIGVLASSSNNSAYTVHQDKDLTFRVMAARYTQTSKTLALGSVAVDNATDLLIAANVVIPDAQTRVEFVLGLPDGTTFTVAAGQPVRLPSAITGQVSVTAKLYGTTTRSPVLYPGTNLIVGSQSSTGTYAGRAFPAGNNSKVVVVYDALIPGGSGITATVQGTGAGDAAVSTPQTATRVLDDGYREFIHEVATISKSMVRLNLALSGSPAARPRVRNVRAYAIAAP